jgi:hypothetical protein
MVVLAPTLKRFTELPASHFGTRYARRNLKHSLAGYLNELVCGPQEILTLPCDVLPAASY